MALGSIPVALAYVTKAREPLRAFVFGAMFVLGMIATHAVLGAAAGFGGGWVERLLGRHRGLVPGPLLILLGLLWPGWIRLPLPAISMRALGVPFSVAVCPVCTPALFVLLGVVAASGSPLFGLAAGLAFALEGMKALGRYHRAFEIAGAAVLILSGLYMLNAYFILIPSLAI